MVYSQTKSDSSWPIWIIFPPHPPFPLVSWSFYPFFSSTQPLGGEHLLTKQRVNVKYCLHKHETGDSWHINNIMLCLHGHGNKVMRAEKSSIWITQGYPLNNAQNIISTQITILHWSAMMFPIDNSGCHSYYSMFHIIGKFISY